MAKNFVFPSPDLDYFTSDLMRKIIFGVAVGDALGFPVQFLDRNSTNRFPIVDMGYILNPKGEKQAVSGCTRGEWSDDTSLTLCLAESLANGFDLKDQAERMIAWLQNGYLSARDHAFDIGRQTRIALLKLSQLFSESEDPVLSHLIDSPSESANGNGALMRILPLLPYTYGKPLSMQFDLVMMVSALTHPHMRSALCCMFYLRYAERLLWEQDKKEAYVDTQADLIDLMEFYTTEEHDKQELHRLCYNDISKLTSDTKFYNEPNYLHSKGYVVHSLEAALWCVLNNDNYADTVLAAVRLGNDTDSIAAIAGGLAALIYGYESIPEAWIEALQKPALFEQVLALYPTYEG